MIARFDSTSSVIVKNLEGFLYLLHVHLFEFMHRALLTLFAA